MSSTRYECQRGGRPYRRSDGPHDCRAVLPLHHRDHGPQDRDPVTRSSTRRVGAIVSVAVTAVVLTATALLLSHRPRGDARSSSPGDGPIPVDTRTSEEATALPSPPPGFDPHADDEFAGWELPSDRSTWALRPEGAGRSSRPVAAQRLLKRGCSSAGGARSGGRSQCARPYRSPTGISTATVLPGCARGHAQAGS